ncbi:MAG: hypothetical protein KF803_02905 [Cyclobacteriaceae bacterium]|nr:hypothetical protein [Cyclobacteriaceae bacterium]
MLPADQDIESFLLRELKRFVDIPSGYGEELIRLNLFFLFCQNDTVALRFTAFIEEYFQIQIPDGEVDYYFLSDLTIMSRTIGFYLNKEKIS